MENIWPWIAFNLFVFAMLALDLGVFHKKSHEVHFREALAWSAVWILLALAFNAGIYYFQGSQKALEFLTGYVIEKSLSVDNIFVFLLIFSYFAVPSAYQHKVLFWGILGALVMRAILIAAGIVLLEKFHWLIYIFGAFLIITGIKMAFEKDKEIHPEKNPILLFLRKRVGVTSDFRGDRFMVREGGKRLLTPLFIVLVFVELTDLVFAVDSIPAILAITRDPFIVYTSNVFAILGLRALYFAVAGFLKYFHHLHYGLSAILIFVGIKMSLVDFFKVSTPVSLAVVGGILALSVAASLIWPRKGAELAHPAHKEKVA